jgi:hypothetical protein
MKKTFLLFLSCCACIAQETNTATPWAIGLSAEARIASKLTVLTSSGRQIEVEVYAPQGERVADLCERLGDLLTASGNTWKGITAGSDPGRARLEVAIISTNDTDLVAFARQVAIELGEPNPKVNTGHKTNALIFAFGDKFFQTKRTTLDATNDLVSGLDNVVLTLTSNQVIVRSNFFALRNAFVLGSLSVTGAIANAGVVRTWAGNTGNFLIPANVTYFYALNGNSITNVQTSDTTCWTRNLVTRQTTLQNFYVQLSAAPGASRTTTVTVMTNGVASSIVATITAGATTGNDTTRTETIAAGTEVGIRIGTVASTVTARASWAIEGK